MRSAKLRFQSAARKVVHVNRAMSYTKVWAKTTREPGIDARYIDLPDLVSQCVVQVVELSREVRGSSCFISCEQIPEMLTPRDRSQDARFTVLENADVPGFLAKPRPDWVKVRWLHVGSVQLCRIGYIFI